jgi:serine kinase of HPr protein (carbohydrate metabolism regulator)
MSDEKHQKLHASCISINGHGIMLAGPSGAGKSDLALRLIDRGAKLISDDYTIVARAENQIMLSPPKAIAGKIEVASLGIFEIEYVTKIPLMLKICLNDGVERFPMDQKTETILGQSVPTVAIDSNHASAPIKVEMALKDLLERRLHS